MKVTIIGAGNMGGAIAVGLANGTFIEAEDITCVDRNPRSLARLKATGKNFVLTSDLKAGVRTADATILAVKPHSVPEVIAATRDVVDYKRQILFSAVAGVTFEEMDKMLLGGVDKADAAGLVHFRIMTSIAISINDAMTFIASRNANAAQVQMAETMFGEMGQTMVVPERMLPAAMAVGSCGIAYAMRYVRAAMIGAIEAGFSADEAHEIVLQTIKGAIRLLYEGGQHPEVEIDRVITPGGYTIRGLNAMEEHGFSNSIIHGIRESYKNGK